MLAVFASHVHPLTSGGWIGVEVFFVLSGYLITGLLLREKRATGRISFGRFYARRALRLYPALIVLLLAGLVFYRQVSGSLGEYGWAALFSALYVQDLVAGADQLATGTFGHTWSLAVEEQFYLLWPPLLLLLLRRRRSVTRWTSAATVVILAALAVYMAMTVHTLIPGSYFLPWVQFSVLLAGCALAASGWVPAGRTASLCAWVGGAGLVVLVPIPDGSRLDYLAPMLFGAAVLTVLLIAGLQGQSTGTLARLLSWRPITYLGRISYGFYLYHYLVLTTVGEWMGENGFLRREVVVVELVVTFAAAATSYHLVEQPFLGWKRRFAAPMAASTERDARVAS